MNQSPVVPTHPHTHAHPLARIEETSFLSSMNANSHTVIHIWLLFDAGPTCADRVIAIIVVPDGRWSPPPDFVLYVSWLVDFPEPHVSIQCYSSWMLQLYAPDLVPLVAV